MALTRSLAASLALLASGHALAGTAIRDRTVEVEPGVAIHLLDAGPARSALPALVLIPGWRATAGIWRRQLEAFSAERRVVAIDPRSQGESTKTAEGATPEQRARDLDALLRKLDLGPVVLVGWSQGVQDVAAHVEAFGLTSLRGVVLVDAAVSDGAAGIVRNPTLASAQLRMLAGLSRQPRAWSEGMMKAIISRPLSQTELDHLVDEALKTPTAIAVAMVVADLFGVDRTPVLAKLDRPALVIASATSSELEAQRAMAARLPQGRLAVVADAGHAVFIDQPERFDALLREFLKSVGS